MTPDIEQRARRIKKHHPQIDLEWLIEHLEAVARSVAEDCRDIAKQAIDLHTLNDKTFISNDCATWIAAAIEERYGLK